MSLTGISRPTPFIRLTGCPIYYKSCTFTGSGGTGRFQFEWKRQTVLVFYNDERIRVSGRSALSRSALIADVAEGSRASVVHDPVLLGCPGRAGPPTSLTRDLHHQSPDLSGVWAGPWHIPDHLVQDMAGRGVLRDLF